MSETGKTILTRTTRYSVILCAVAALVCWLIFPAEGLAIALSIAAGGFAGLLGLFLIIRFTGALSTAPGGQVRGRAFASYLVRYLLYGALMVLTHLAGGSLLGFLAGFVCTHLSLLFYSYSLRKES